MKKIIALFLCLALCLSFAACDKDASGGKGKNAKVGDTLKAPEKIAELGDFEKLTVYTSFNMGGVDTQAQTCSYYKNGDIAVYYYEISVPRDNFSMEYYTLVKDGKATSYNNGWSDFQLVDSLSDTMTDEEWHKMNLAYLGINPEKDGTIIEYVKQEDDEFNGKDCYVYTVKYEEGDSEEEVSDSTVWVDKETGLWIKSSFTVDGIEVTRTVTGVEESVLSIPGTLPASIEATDVYNTLNFRLTAKKLDTSNPNFAGVITFEAENKSDKDIRVYTNSFDANGLTLAQKAFDETVSAGATVEFECNIPDSSAELAKIEIIKDITMNLHLETTDGTLIEDIEAERIKTDAPALLVQEIDKTGMEILNENGVRVVFQSFEFVKGRPMFKAWVENDFTEPVRVTINLNKINGEEYDDFEKLYMPSHSEGYSAFYLSDDEITELESVEITAEAFSGALFNSDRVTEETEPVTIELK